MTIKRIGVIGAGLMGSGIAQVASQSGFEVNLMDVEERFIQKGVTTIEKNLKRMVDKGIISAADAGDIRGRIKTCLTLADLARDVDMTIEAVIENLDLKKRVYSELDSLAAPEVIFASNTSALSITEMAGATNRQDKFIGMHFLIRFL